MSQKEKGQQVFVKWCKANLKAVPMEKTLENKAKTLSVFVSKYGLHIDNPNPSEVLEKMNEADLSPYSLKSYKTTLKQWLESKGVEMTKDLLNGLKHQSGQRRRVVQSDDLVTREELLDIVDHTVSQALRAYYLTLFDSGARPGALCQLNISDIEADRYGFVVRFRKAKTEQSKRTVRLLDPVAIRHLEQWLTVHPKRDEPDAPLFVNRYGNRFNVETVLNVLRKHNERLGRGDGKRASLNPYLFRKSRATQLLRDAKLTETEIRLRLGHSRHSRMLEQYYDIRDESDQQRAELRAMGIETSEEETTKTVMCPNCAMQNEPEASKCSRCKFPLNESALTEELQHAEEREQHYKKTTKLLKVLIKGIESGKIEIDKDTARELLNEDDEETLSE